MIHWGLVGCGDLAAKRIAPALRDDPNSNLRAVMHYNVEKVNSFAEKFEIPVKYNSMDELVKDNEIQAVYIATPVHLHYEQAVSAMKAGKHVLVEKPMAMNTHQCQDLVDIAEKHKVNLGVAYYRRFFPKLQEVRRLMENGCIGDVIHARILYHSWYNPKTSNAWRITKSLAGGGPLWDIGTHRLDLLIDLLGMPTSVSALMDTITHDYEVEDSCSLLIEFKNKAHGLASFNWNSKVWADEIEILGTKGKITLNPCDSGNIELWENSQKIKGMGKQFTIVSIPNHGNVHSPLIEDFTNSIMTGTQHKVTGLDGLNVNKILYAAEQAVKYGQKVMIN